MTAPNFESIMPYGVTVKSVEGQAYPILPSGPKSRGKTGIMLPDGPCQVMASWGGPDDMRLVLYGEEGVRDSYGKKADLDVIEASPGGEAFHKDGYHRRRPRRLGRAAACHKNYPRILRNNHGVPARATLVQAVV